MQQDSNKICMITLSDAKFFQVDNVSWNCLYT